VEISQYVQGLIQFRPGNNKIRNDSLFEQHVFSKAKKKVSNFVCQIALGKRRCLIYWNFCKFIPKIRTTALGAGGSLNSKGRKMCQFVAPLFY
jgi:hypothetical protein